VLSELTRQLAGGTSLTDGQARDAVAQLVSETIAAETKADFLIALARKGETTGEIAAFARELRSMAATVPLDETTRAGEILDVCGTGGDRLNTFNISTTVAVLCAAAGVTVAKHGNRAITSQSGSADVLEALGIPTDLSPEQAAQALRENGFAFLWAPKFHPAFKHIAPARKLCAERGQKTIFNFLGPLLNPAHPSAQLIGVPRPELCEPMARVLQSLGIRRAMVVCGRIPLVKLAGTAAAQEGRDAHLDELSTLGETVVAEFYQDRAFAASTLDASHFPLQPATLADLAGGDAQANAEILRRLLRGEERGPKRDAVLLNAAAALFLAGKCKSLDAGWALAAETIDSGKAHAKLAALQAAPKPAAAAVIPMAVVPRYRMLGSDNRQYGPAPADQVRRWIAEGRANNQTLLSREGTGAWAPLASLPEFASATVPPPIGRDSVDRGAQPSTNPLAVAGMISGILSILSFCCCCCGFWGAFVLAGALALDILGIVLSSMALSQIKKDPLQQGKGMAVTGLVSALIALILRIAVLAIGVTTLLGLLGLAAASGGRH
jgi:anthranilate phosphoribosyltransferase